jgi:hypothetical protein
MAISGNGDDGAMTFLRAALALLMLLVAAAAGRAAADDDDVRNLIAEWYAQMRKGEPARPWTLMAPGGVLLPQECPDQCGPRARVAQPTGPYNSYYLARRSKAFEYEITRIRVEQTLARVDVWERGFSYAWALKKTTQAAAAATFILEKRSDEGWKVLLYRSESRALRPKDRDAAIPDLSPKAP